MAQNKLDNEMLFNEIKKYHISRQLLAKIAKIQRNPLFIDGSVQRIDCDYLPAFTGIREDNDETSNYVPFSPQDSNGVKIIERSSSEHSFLYTNGLTSCTAIGIIAKKAGIVDSILLAHSASMHASFEPHLYQNMLHNITPE